MMSSSRDKLYSTVEIKKISHVKNSINCILENGAYSDSNYERQMSKKSKNYTNFEKTLVTLGYRYKKFYGEQLQLQLAEFLLHDNSFLDYIRQNDQELYKEVEEIKKNGCKL